MEHGKKIVLVTGATGFLGRRLVETFVERGYRVRALARRSSSIERIKGAGAEIIFGDIVDAASLKPAFQDVDVVVHAAADTKGAEDETKLSTIQGTKNVIDLCEEFKVSKLIHISSLSVYGVADYPENEMVTENSFLERHPERRGFYSWGKLEAEKLVTKAIKKGAFSIVCLRPGTIFGPGGEIFTPMMGYSMGGKLFAIIGMGGFVLPLVYIDNLVDAIVAVIGKEEADGKVFNVVDPGSITKKDYVKKLLQRIHPKAYFIYIPYWLIYMAVWLQEYLVKLGGRAPFLTCYRLTSSQRNVLYDASRIRNELKWKPPYSMEEAMESVIAGESKKAQARR
jgi:2-alkyl-3-oxoalkanoate reductase